jgi:DNA-binding GntR family transcriptional regulator
MDPETRHRTAPKQTSSARVYGAVKKEILQVKLPPGSPLDELSLAERFNISRSPVREALARLSSEGLVVILPNRSAVVAPMDIQRVPEFLDALDLLQRVVTRLAALHRTPDELKAIQEAERSFEEAVARAIETGDTIPIVQSNYDFHLAIAIAGHNSYFQDLYRRLLEEGQRITHVHFNYTDLASELTVHALADHHVQMIDAIAKQDAQRAEDVAHLHAEQFRGQFMQFLNRKHTGTLTLEYRRAD